LSSCLISRSSRQRARRACREGTRARRTVAHLCYFSDRRAPAVGSFCLHLFGMFDNLVVTRAQWIGGASGRYTQEEPAYLSTARPSVNGARRVSGKDLSRSCHYWAPKGIELEVMRAAFKTGRGVYSTLLSMFWRCVRCRSIFSPSKKLPAHFKSAYQHSIDLRQTA
jgi:hypothetical protein